MFDRRKFLQLGLGVLPLGMAPSHASSSLGLVNTTADLVLEEVQIQIAGLPWPLRNYRIGFLADLHLGVNVPAEWIVQALEMLKGAKIDLLLLGGDYIAINDSLLSQTLATSRNKQLAELPYSAHPHIVFPQLASLVKNFPARDGICAVFGNHDLWVEPQLCRSSFLSAQVQFLVNEQFMVDRGGAQLRVIGFDDYWNGVPSWPDTLPAEIPPSEVRVALSHNPDQLSLLLNKTDKRFSLGLAGHTHGGQISLPVVGSLFYNVKDQQLGAGLYKHPNGSITYTSRGLGVVEIPYRFNCPPEVTVLELLAA